MWKNASSTFESRKSPTVVVFDVDTGRISIRHYEILKSITLNWGGGRGVKENNVNVSNIEIVKEKDLNDEPVAMDVQSPLVDQTNAVKTGGGSYPPLPTQGTTLAGNTPGGNRIDVVVVESIRAISERFVNTAYDFFLGKRVAYPVVANYIKNTWGKFGFVKSMLNSSTGLFSFQFSSMDGLNSMLENGQWFIRNHPLILRKWNPDVDLMKEDVGNVPVWFKLHGVPVTAFSKDGLSAIAMKLDTPLMLDSYTSDMCLQSWGRSRYARVMIELWADVELKDNIVVAIPKIMREGYYTCTVRVEYEWKPPRCSCCKVFGHTQEECPKNIGLGVTKNLKKPSQTSRGVSVGPKVGFKPHKEYRPVPKKPTASPSGNKKKGVGHTYEVSNSNLFDVLNLGDNDEELGTNGGTTNLDNNGVNSSGSSFKNVKVALVILLLLIKSESLKIYLLMGKLYLWTKLRDSYGNGDYDEDPYDDDMYEGQDLSQEIQAICDNLDIRVRGRKKK
ncbi:retrotransposon protein, putative, ty1-copia subclass [Tanacetum coccineum]